jgi:hypothetical protein
MVSLGPRVRLCSRSVIGPATRQPDGDSGPIALVSFGIATIVRQQAVPIGTILGLPYLFPIVISVVSDPH